MKLQKRGGETPNGAWSTQFVVVPTAVCIVYYSGNDTTSKQQHLVRRRHARILLPVARYQVIATLPVVSTVGLNVTSRLSLDTI